MLIKMTNNPLTNARLIRQDVRRVMIENHPLADIPFHTLFPPNESATDVLKYPETND